VDVAIPEISNVKANPSLQEAGGWVNITFDVMDNVGIDEVCVNIAHPDRTTHNFSMNGGSYYFNHIYSLVGEYNYFVWVNDTSGNANASNIKTFTIIPTPQYTLTTSVNPSGSGYITLSPSGETYDAGNLVTVTAHANDGYEFSHWSGDASGKSASIRITMDSDKSIIAHFVVETHPNEFPKANFTYSADGLRVSFSDKSNDSDSYIKNWNWTFGDNDYSMRENPTHEYEKGGNYTVTLTITDDDGDTDSYTLTITVEKEEKDGIPGFELVFLVIGIVVALMFKRKSSL
jgi:PKD repeat protein